MILSVYISKKGRCAMGFFVVKNAIIERDTLYAW